jgi:ornithine cyclodeaminase/alanine dehydrogenase-like protein (mu-crystallin family)
VIHVLSGGEFRRLVPMRDAIEAVRDAFVAVSEQRADQPARLVSRDQRALTMMARLGPSNDTVVKTVTISPENRSIGLPTLHAVVLCFDGTTGEPALLIDGDAVTALRTGAASGVATDLLAAPDAHVLAVIGSGAQADDQIAAVCAVRKIQEVRLVSRNRKTCEALARRVLDSQLGVAVSVHDDVVAAIDGADVVCTATTSTTPLFPAAALAPGAHVNAIGAYTASMCELAPAVLAGAAIIAVDEIDASLIEAGDVIQALELGELTRDRLQEIGTLLGGPPIARDGRHTVFKSVGLAAQDWAVAAVARRHAVTAPKLREIELNDLAPYADAASA